VRLKVNPRPTTVRPLPNHELEIKFSNGESRVFNMKPYLEFGVFRELKNVSYFNQAQVQHDTVTWPNEQDVCPDTLYEEGKPLGRNGAA
jgi:hypothetical protein